MSCPAMTLSGLTPEKYAALLQAANAQGLAIAGPSGATKYQGMEFTWSYDQPAATLTIQCTSKPFYVPCSVIEEKIRQIAV
jgi:hypothetical protein